MKIRIRWADVGAMALASAALTTFVIILMTSI